MSRLTRLVLRVLAVVALAALLVGVPLVVISGFGLPLPTRAQLGDAWTSSRVDGDLVMGVGASVFALLWSWFALTALAELWQVMAWRFGRGEARLALLPAGPKGWVRSLVRFALVSSMSVGATLGGMTTSVRSVPAAAMAERAPQTTTDSAFEVTIPAASSVHLANGRDTPYSLAGSLGRPELRDSIIKINAGRLTPQGSAWSGGVFPVGMEVLLPSDDHGPGELATLLGPAHEVVAGDCYWTIAEDHLSSSGDHEPTPAEVLDYTNRLVALNSPLLGHRDPTLIHPGELVLLGVTVGEPEPDPGPAPESESGPGPVEVEATPPVATPPPMVATPPPPVATPPPQTVSGEVEGEGDSSAASPMSYTAGIGTALLLAAGAVGALEARRRRRLRATMVGDRLDPPDPAQVRTEVLLRSLGPAERLARLDMALRAAAVDVAEHGAVVTAAVLGNDGDVRLYLNPSVTPTSPLWLADVHGGSWSLPASVELGVLASVARESAHPCPALVHIGAVPEGGELFVDLEAIGVLAVESVHAPAILSNLAASLSVSPFVESSRVFTVGLGEIGLGDSFSEALDSLDAALDAAAVALGSTSKLLRGSNTFAMRVGGAGGESWEPAIVIASGGHDVELLAGLPVSVRPGGGVGVAVEGEVPGAKWVLRSHPTGHVLEPLGLQVLPSGLDPADLAAVGDLLEAAGLPAERHATVVPIRGAKPFDEPFSEPAWSLMVRVLGQVEVVSRDGTVAEFERSKALELVVWLSQHRERPTRIGARTALWDLDVRDTTFANVVSDARRGLARAITPAEAEEWIARTLNSDLPLHRGVVTDAELVAMRLEHSRGLAPLDAIELLRPGVELLAGMPFAGTGFLWTDAEGIASSLVLLATGAAIELASHYLELGDTEGVFWATGQGLKVLAGHEELIALRMRAHARRGDLAGVRHEWESYERALAAEPWAEADPAPKLVSLRRELLGVRAG